MYTHIHMGLNALINLCTYNCYMWLLMECIVTDLSVTVWLLLLCECRLLEYVLNISSKNLASVVN